MVKYFIGSYDYNILSQASYQGGNAAGALQFADEAVNAADNTHTKSEALRSKAIVIMQARGNSGAPDAENALHEAEEALDKVTGNEMPSYAIAFDRAFLYVTMSMIDLNIGNCTRAAEDAAKALSFVSPTDNPIMNSAYGMVATQIAGGIQGQRCPVSSFPAVIQSLASSMPAQPIATAPASAVGSQRANPFQPNATASGLTLRQAGPRARLSK